MGDFPRTISIPQARKCVVRTSIRSKIAQPKTDTGAPGDMMRPGRKWQPQPSRYGLRIETLLRNCRQSPCDVSSHARLLIPSLSRSVRPLSGKQKARNALASRVITGLSVPY